MANADTLKGLLDAIGDAIRAKTGGSAKLTLAEMPDEIAGISGGGEFDFSQVAYTSTTPFVKTLASLDLSGIDSSNVSTFAYLFGGMSNLASIDLNPLSDASPRSMQGMFSGCSSLASIDLSMLNASTVTDMNGMFKGCSSMTQFDFDGLDTSAVTVAPSMFSDCSALSGVNFASADLSSLHSIQSMFAKCTSLTSMDLSALVLSSDPIEAGSLFTGCSSLVTAKLPNATYKTCASMFSGCGNLTSIDFSGATFSNLPNAMYMFSTCSSLTSLTLPQMTFNASATTVSLQYMFYGCSSLEYLDMSGFRAENNMAPASNALSGCTALKTLVTGSQFLSNKFTFPVAMQDENGNQFARGASIPAGAHTYTATA